MDYTAEELMVVAASREIKDHEVVIVGTRLPILAFSLAKMTHAPNAVGFFDCGIVRDTPTKEFLYTMGDTPNLTGSQWCTTTNNLMFLLQQGLVNVGFIGGAEVDKFGNINTSYIGDYKETKVKLPGSGGGADFASLSERLLVIMNHEKRRLRDKVDYITSPGYGSGYSWREEVGLPRGGVGTLITNLGLMTPNPETKELELTSIHPHVSVEEVRESTGWELKVSDNLIETRLPSLEELEAIRSMDPEGFWTGGRGKKQYERK
jgi:glutaconate CoA-transferase, subunit B